jgi:phenylalanyl-tRNA synthetase beta chain
VLPHEAEAVSIVLSGRTYPENWTGLGRPNDFYTLKGVVETALCAVGLEGSFSPLGDQAAAFAFLHPGKGAVVSVPEAGGVGVLGLLRPDVAAAYGVEGLDLYVASLNLDRLSPVAQPTVSFRDLVTYPPAEQDLAVVVDGGVPAADVVATARKAGGKLVAEVRVFDVYEGDQVPVGKRSLALRVLMRSAERTLNDKDIATVRAKIVGALEREFGAVLR